MNVNVNGNVCRLRGLFWLPPGPPMRLSKAPMKVHVIVTPKKSVLDPQGVAVRDAIHHLGFDAVKEVRVGKILELEVDESTAGLEDKLKSICSDLLSNPVIEDYRIEKP